MGGIVFDAILGDNGMFFDPTQPHRIAGQCLQDGQPVQRRIVVRKRRSGAYVRSCISEPDGTFELRHLPQQHLNDHYVVTCYDDTRDSYGNAQIVDYVYQVDDDGNPPQT